jgi:hypothetical protein
MATRDTASLSLKSTAGAFLLVLGMVILSANLDAIAACMAGFAGISVPQESSILTALALAALHVTQTYAFDHGQFLSSLLRILVSFWPAILILAGVWLLRDVFRVSFLGRGADVGPTAAGEL